MVDGWKRGVVRKKNATVKAEVDESVQVTSCGGLAIVEHLCQRIGFWKHAEQALPERVKYRGYASVTVLSSVMHGLLMGGRGFHAAQCLRHDEAARRMLGMKDGMPEEATVNRAMCDLAGLVYREEETTYEQDTRVPHSSKSLFGEEPPADKPRKRRIVGPPEPADAERLEIMEQLLRRQAARLLPGLPTSATHVGGFLAVFGDATQLEVSGRCFDAAERDYNGNRALQWLTLWVGPLLAGEVLRGGARDEADLHMQLERVDREVVRRGGGGSRGVLFLADSAQGEEKTLREVERLGWRYIVGYSRDSAVNRAADEQPESQWVDTGAQPERGWASSAVCAMYHMAGSWSKARTMVVRRYQKEGELPHHYHYRVVLTDLEPEDVRDVMRREKCSYPEAIWRLYDHKQARENQFKAPLSDMGLHHPPSGRLGLNQVFYLVASMALNLASAVSWTAVAQEHRGMRLWRLRQWYLGVAAFVRRHAKQVTIRATGALSEQLRTAWLGAFARITTVW